MSTYEAIQPMISQLSENDLIKLKEYLIRLTSSPEEKTVEYNPFHPLSREEIISQLSIARKHAEEGRVMDAHMASDNVRARYGMWPYRFSSKSLFY